MLVNQLKCIKHVNSLCKMSFIWSFKQLKCKNILNTKPFEFENNIGKIHSHDLRGQSLSHFIISSLMIYSKTFTIRNSSRSPSSLIGIAFSTRHNDHLINSSFPIISLYFHVTWINNILDIRYCYRTFSNICGKNYLSFVASLEYLVLVLTS